MNETIYINEVDIAIKHAKLNKAVDIEHGLPITFKKQFSAPFITELFNQLFII